MQIINQTVRVGEDGWVTLQVSRPLGAQVRVIVFEESDTAQNEAMALARWQEQSGFACQVLADPAEDVWNDL